MVETPEPGNPDFVPCEECGGEFYKGDLNPDGYCEDCQEMIEAQTSGEGDQ